MPSSSDAYSHSHATDAQHDDSQPLCHTPPGIPAHTTADGAQLSSEPFDDTLLIRRADECLGDLSRLPAWDTTTQLQWSIAKNLDLKQLLPGVRLFASYLCVHKESLVAILPELSDALSDKLSFAYTLANVYQHPRPRFFDSYTDVDHARAVAYLLVYAAQSHARLSRERESALLRTNAHFTAQFGRPYRGDASLRFLTFVTKYSNHIRTGTDRANYYFRGTPVVQSSGTGKSRMILELKTHTPLLYVCLQNPEADGNAKTGYPLADEGVRKYFEDANKTHANLCDLQVACFLKAWFETLVKHLRRFESASDKVEALVQLNCLDRPNPERIAFFKAVSELATTLLTGTPSKLRVQPGIIRETNDAVWQPLDDDLIFRSCLQQSILDISRELAVLSQHLHGMQSSTGEVVPPVLVAFDECVEINVSNSPGGNNQFNSLIRAWHYIRKLEDTSRTQQHLWLVLLSTSSRAVVPVERVSFSSTLRGVHSERLPTFVATSFDVFDEERPSISCAGDASRLDQLVIYGRPLWASLDRSGFWKTATIKLQGGETFSPHEPVQCFSIVASRLALRLTPAHEEFGQRLPGVQKMFLDKSVDRNMRIVTRVTERATMVVESLSEPVLALAASLLMVPRALQATDEQDASIAPNWYGLILECFRTRCLLERNLSLFEGTKGELAVCIALTAAWDAVKQRAVPAEPSSEEQMASTLSRPVLLCDIIAGLANLDVLHLAILQRRIESVQQVVLRSDPSATVQAWTHFTHFDRLPESISEITPEFLWGCWKRGAALQMATSQEGVDGIIPVFVGDLSKPFGVPVTATEADRHVTVSDVANGARHMTYVAWRAGAKGPRVGESAEIKLELAGPAMRKPVRSASDKARLEPLTQRALMCILADLGSSTTFPSTRDQRPQVEMILDTDCPRLWIRGCSDKNTYPCLDYLKVRRIFGQIAQDTGAAQPFYDENAYQHPLWNSNFNALLPAAPA